MARRTVSVAVAFKSHAESMGMALATQVVMRIDELEPDGHKSRDFAQRWIDDSSRSHENH
jgi:hypothetical protein